MQPSPHEEDASRRRVPFSTPISQLITSGRKLRNACDGMRRMEIRVLPVDFRHSDWHCMLEFPQGDTQAAPQIRIGLRLISAFDYEVAETIRSVRTRRVFIDVTDLAPCAGPSRRCGRHAWVIGPNDAGGHDGTSRTRQWWRALPSGLMGRRFHLPNRTQRFFSLRYGRALQPTLHSRRQMRSRNDTPACFAQTG